LAGFEQPPSASTCPAVVSRSRPSLAVTLFERNVEQDLAELYLEKAVEDERAVAAGNALEELDAGGVRGLGGKQRFHDDARIKQNRFRRPPISFLEREDGTR
jgi:hypothetical protein